MNTWMALALIAFGLVLTLGAGRLADSSNFGPSGNIGIAGMVAGILAVIAGFVILIVGILT